MAVRPWVLLLSLCLACLLASGGAAQRSTSASIDPDKLAAAGVRVLRGKHLTLLTDLPATPEIDELTAVFDAAVPQWAEYFGVPPRELEDWRVLGSLIEDRERFRALRLMPREKPGFVNGFANAKALWLVEQPSAYYRRHLLLHEGTHAFVLSRFSELGPDWYREGVAELFGTHTWDGERLVMRVVPESRASAPYWGRIKHLRAAVETQRVPTLERLMETRTSTRDSARSYSWCWAAAVMLDTHPDHRGMLSALARDAREGGFNGRFRKRTGEGWDDLQTDWAAWIAGLDYGADPEALRVLHRAVGDVPADEVVCEIDAALGWQSSGLRLRAGRRYRLSAEGRYRVAADGGVWPCEPGGITLDYFGGRPIGQLLAAVAPAGSATARDFSVPTAVGLGATLTPRVEGVLFLRVNKSPVVDQSGGVVRVRVARD
ncbi:MAG: hypothetical protein AAGA92_05865 [Planctomycetota bacterium]